LEGVIEGFLAPGEDRVQRLDGLLTDLIWVEARLTFLSFFNGSI
jgi:hypothetical protein